MPAIDLSQLPAPTVVEALDFETILAAMRADLQARWPEFSAAVESDPVMKVLEVAAYRELLLRQRVNDAARGVLVATAAGADLDNLGALLNVRRLVVTPADPAANPPRAAVLEDDARFRQRIVLALEGYPTAGATGAYRFHALSATADVKDVAVRSPYPGKVRVVVLSRAVGGAADAALLATVQAALSDETVRPLTDSVEVVSAAIAPYRVTATLHVQSGPDALVVKRAAEDAVAAYVAGRHAIGAGVAVSGLLAALHQPGCRTVRLAEPAADLEVGPDSAPFCEAITITVEEG